MKATALFADSGGYKPLPTIEALRVVAQGHALESVTDARAALLILKQRPEIELLVSNAPDLELFTQFRALHPKGTSILVTDLAMKNYSALLQGQEADLVDHIIVNKGRENWTVNQLRVTLHKLRTKDIFGIDKYLAPHTPIHREVIRSSIEREGLNLKVQKFAEACHLGQHISRVSFGISEELLMNTIYDAPAAAGIERFQNIDQVNSIVLQPEEYGELSYACDGQILAIASSDPFGALKKETLLTYLKKVLRREDGEGLIDTKKGGAGLGLFKILYSSHGIVCNVSKGTKTEIMALIDINDPLRDFASLARSIHYFSK
ncbi:MAG: hypothetical protein EOP07_05730 [Proteobacteria bacterium]|nr:MAG: hypothetical protein EOP07_05730 [Pseudomonadota bacterium]